MSLRKLLKARWRIVSAGERKHPGASLHGDRDGLINSASPAKLD